MLSQVDIKKIINRIIEKFQPNKIIIFGSYANGEATSDSDLDLLIIKDSNMPSRFQNRKLRKLLSDFNISVDVVVKTSDELKKYKDIIGTIIYPANKFGKVVYESR